MYTFIRNECRNIQINDNTVVDWPADKSCYWPCSSGEKVRKHGDCHVDFED